MAADNNKSTNTKLPWGRGTDPWDELAARYQKIHPATLKVYEPGIGALHSLDYERHVEQPRKQGRDPVWDALLAEALADNPQPLHKAS